MIDNQQKVESLLDEFEPDIKRLDKMVLNLSAVNSIQFAHKRLVELRIEMTMPYFLEIEALTTAFVISYGRLFKETKGTTKLKRSIIPKGLQSTHDELIKLRDSRYAHHGNHDSINSSIELNFDGEKIMVNSQLKVGYCVGAPKNWGPLVDWLGAYMYDSVNKQLEYLSNRSGLEWAMYQGEKPTWF